MLAIVVQAPVAGSHISAGRTEPEASLKPVSMPLPTEVPPVTSTLPSARTVAFMCRRGYCIEPVHCHPFAVFRSMVSAVLVGGPPPPTISTLPGSYITAEAASREGERVLGPPAPPPP